MIDHDPWSTDPAAWPEGAAAEHRWQYLLNFAVLAPSGHNTQPWLFRIDGDRLELFADRHRALPVVDPHDRELTISCGAALESLLTALRHFGHEGDVELLPDAEGNPDLLARVGFGPSKTPDDRTERRFQAIFRRRTTRRPFEPEPIAEGVLNALGEGVREAGAEIVFVIHPSAKADVAWMVSEGDRLQFADPRFRRELAAWIHSRRRDSHDGISFSEFGGADILSFAGAAVVRTFDMGDGIAAKDSDLAEHSPVLALIATDEDRPEYWLTAGRALTGLLLDAAAHGLTAAYLNQPIEIESLRRRLADDVGPPGIPQLLLRLGKGPEVEPAARRSVREVLIS
jgi:hypothetical protein